MILLGNRQVAGRELSPLLLVWLVFNYIFLSFLPLSSAPPGLLGQKSSVLRHFILRRGHVLEFGLDGYMQKLLLSVWVAIFLYDRQTVLIFPIVMMCTKNDFFFFLSIKAAGP